MSEAPGAKRGPEGPTISIKISDETHRGVYANKVIIGHTSEEFILDFVADFPPGPQIVARVITAPAHAVAFLEALKENVGRFEQQHGAVRRPRAAAPPAKA